MTSRLVELRLKACPCTLRFVIVLLITVFFPLPIDRTATATTAGALARRAIIGL